MKKSIVEDLTKSARQIYNIMLENARNGFGGMTVADIAEDMKNMGLETTEKAVMCQIQNLRHRGLVHDIAKDGRRKVYEAIDATDQQALLRGYSDLRDMVVSVFNDCVPVTMPAGETVVILSHDQAVELMDKAETIR